MRISIIKVERIIIFRRNIRFPSQSFSLIGIGISFLSFSWREFWTWCTNSNWILILMAVLVLTCSDPHSREIFIALIIVGAIREVQPRKSFRDFNPPWSLL